MKPGCLLLCALGVYLIYLSKLTGNGAYAAHVNFSDGSPECGGAARCSFCPGNFLTMFFFTGAALAIALGFRQSAWEPSQGTALYLLHLPLTRRTIFLTKLFTGSGLLGVHAVADLDLCERGQPCRERMPVRSNGR